MFCPNCGTQNVDTNRFCIKCGTTLPTLSAQAPVRPPVQSQPYSPPISAPTNPLASAALTGGLAGLAGGVLTVIGWLMPWSGIGIGSGLQVTIATLTGSLAAFEFSRNSFTGAPSGGGIVFGCLGIAMAAVIASIPLIGILCARMGIGLIESRSSAIGRAALTLQGELGTLRSRSAKGFGLMLVIYVLSSLIPFAQLLLSNGYFVAGGGFALIFLGALFAQSQIGTSRLPSQSTLSERRLSTVAGTLGSAQGQTTAELRDQETKILELVGQGLSNSQIAEQLGSNAYDVTQQVYGLLVKFGANGTTDLVEKAKALGIIPR